MDTNEIPTTKISDLPEDKRPVTRSVEDLNCLYPNFKMLYLTFFRYPLEYFAGFYDLDVDFCEDVLSKGAIITRKQIKEISEKTGLASEILESANITYIYRDQSSSIDDLLDEIRKITEYEKKGSYLAKVFGHLDCPLLDLKLSICKKIPLANYKAMKDIVDVTIKGIKQLELKTNEYHQSMKEAKEIQLNRLSHGAHFPHFEENLKNKTPMFKNHSKLAECLFADLCRHAEDIDNVDFSNEAITVFYRYYIESGDYIDLIETEDSQNKWRKLLPLTDDTIYEFTRSDRDLLSDHIYNYGIANEKQGFINGFKFALNLLKAMTVKDNV